ncbi:MAG: threonine synthase, partial [Silvibacterium sp.]
IQPDELTVSCITGNGLKTTDALTGAYDEERAIRPRLADFEAYVEEQNEDRELALGGANVR